MKKSEQKELITRLAELLPTVRKMLHMTQEELGNKIGVSRITLNTIENTKNMTWGRFTSILMVLTEDREIARFLKANKVYHEEFASLFNKYKVFNPSKAIFPAVEGSGFDLVKQIAEFMPFVFVCFRREKDGNYKVLYANKPFFAMTGNSSFDEFNEKTHNLVINVINREDLLNVRRAVEIDIPKSEKKSTHIILRINSKNESYRWLNAEIQAAYVEQLGNVYFVFGSDITEQQNRRVASEVNRTTQDQIFKEMENNTANNAVNKLLSGIRILLAESNPESLQQHYRMLTAQGANVQAVSDGARAVSVGKNSNFDLILIDLVLPKIDGVEVIKQIKEHKAKRNKDVPIFGLTIEGADDAVEDAIEAGAYECLYKPISLGILTTSILNYQRKNITEVKTELTQAVKQANTDSLTSVKSASAYLNKIKEFNGMLAKGEKFELGILLCDCDNLKGINDTYGHTVGDVYIKNCSSIICEIFSHSPVYRYGGDEFVVLLQNRDLKEHQYLLKKLEMRIESTRYIETVENGRASVSFGFALFSSKTDNSIEDTISRADKEMYKVKHKHHKQDDARKKSN